jgi:hypothetical protein
MKRDPLFHGRDRAINSKLSLASRAPLRDALEHAAHFRRNAVSARKRPGIAAINFAEPWSSRSYHDGSALAAEAEAVTNPPRPALATTGRHD